MRLFVFPRLLLLPSKSQRSLLTGEFVGRSSETQREMRKQWILSGTAKRPVQPQNQPQKRKNRPEDRSAENSQNGAGEGDIGLTFLRPPKMRIFQLSQDGVVHHLEKFSERFVKIRTTSKSGLYIAKTLSKGFELATSACGLK